MAIFSNKIVAAKFLDNSNTIVEIIYKDGDEDVAFAMEVDFSNPDFQDFLEEMNLEELEKSTYEQRKKREEAKKAYLEARVEERIDESQKAASIMSMDEIIDELFEKKNDINFLFKFKVELFKKDVIKNSSNEEIKKEIRKSKNIFDVLSLLKDI